MKFHVGQKVRINCPGDRLHGLETNVTRAATTPDGDDYYVVDVVSSYVPNELVPVTSLPDNKEKST